MSETVPMINLTIDGKQVAVPKGTTVYTAAQQLKIDIPVFCYLDRMPPFGACRMCLVEVEKSPKLQTSCSLEATEGMVVKTQSQIALEGRAGILELLLINHPLDCPICDKGGECPLQDHTLKCGPGKSRFYEEKRHFKKQLPLSPVLMLDRERCIVCARCTRFGDIIAGDHALEFIDRGFKTEVGTPDGKDAKSKFIGNTIKICPVGALTSRVYRFQARPWDNKPTQSTCTLCPVGCSMTFDSRDGEIVRTLSTENRDVNDIWLCDKGWFGFEFSSHAERLQTPLIRRNGKLEPSSWDDALLLIASKIQQFKQNGKIAGLGGAPLTVEENYLFQKLMREAAGTPHLDYRVGLPITLPENKVRAPGMEISIGEVENLNYAILLGLDLTEEFPVIWLRLKQAINKGAQVIFIGHFSPEIAPHLAQCILHAPGQELKILQKELPQIAALKGKGALFVGRQYLASSDRPQVLLSLDTFIKDKPNLSLNIMEAKENSMGARFSGMLPNEKSGLNWCEVIQAASESGWDLLYVAGANLVKNIPKNQWKQAREKLQFLVVQDLFLTETAQQADVVLPTLCYAEKTGSFINIEGRVQQLKPGKAIAADVFSDGEIFIWLSQKLKNPLQIDPSFQNELNKGHVKLPQPSQAQQNPLKPTSSSSDCLLASFATELFDRGERMKRNTQLIRLAKDPRVRINSKEASKRSLQDHQIVQLKANGIVIEAKIKRDDKIADGTLVIPLGFDQIPVHEWGMNLLNGLPIEIG